MADIEDEEDVPLSLLAQRQLGKKRHRAGASSKPRKQWKIGAGAGSRGKGDAEGLLAGQALKNGALLQHSVRTAVAKAVASLSVSAPSGHVGQLSTGGQLLPSSSSFASNVTTNVEAAKMEQDVATSPMKSAVHMPGDRSVDPSSVPIPCFSDFGLEFFEEDKSMLLPADVSADVSSEEAEKQTEIGSACESEHLDLCPDRSGQPKEVLEPLRLAPPSLEVANPNVTSTSPSLAASQPLQSLPFVNASQAEKASPESLPCASCQVPTNTSSPTAASLPLASCEVPKYKSNAASRKHSLKCNAAGKGHMPDAAAFPLGDFLPGELVWARAGTRYEPFWVAKVVAMEDVSDIVRRSFVPEALCVEFFGPASSKKWDKDYAWVKQGNIFPFLDTATWFGGQILKKRAKDFTTAVREALLHVSALDASSDPVPPELCPNPASVATEVDTSKASFSAKISPHISSSDTVASTKECISCQAPLKKKGKKKEGLDEGHAADLERVCEGCYRLFENKQYCWVCKKIWLPNETAGWVGCDGLECGFWIHADCDSISPERLKAMEEEDAQYHCPRCRADQETAKVAAPDALPVECDGNKGDYLPGEHMIRCRCGACLGRRKVDPAAFERHSKCREGNWRESIRAQRLKTSLSGWLDMMESFKAEGLAYSMQKTTAAKAHGALASVQKRLDAPYTPIHVKWSGERCGVCHSAEDFVDDELITCDRCHVTVHELCYGVRRATVDSEKGGPEDPANEPPEQRSKEHESRNGTSVKPHKVWVCRACEDPVLKPHCCLCPVRGGALKPASIEGRWAHVACAQWVTETGLADPGGAMEPVEGIERIPQARWDLVCTICKQRCGAPIQCQQPRCVRAYHMMCARLDGLFMDMVAKNDGMQTRSYCRQHKAVKAASACVSSSLDAELLKQGHVPPRAKPRLAKRGVAEKPIQKEGARGSGDGSSARCRAYVPRKERQIEAVKRRRIPQLFEGVTFHSRHQLEFLQQQCAVQDRVGESWVHRRQPQAPEGLSVSGLIEHMQATEKSRLSFGKSGIHGWGLIARKKILEGDYVVDYRGTLVRPSVANLREQYYRRIGKDCYLFKVDDQHVVDATETGNLGRLINHSCGPNCYSQIKRVDGITRIILRAKRDVEAGEELTYDYRFEQEDKDRVPCRCGAPNCRKFMN